MFSSKCASDDVPGIGSVTVRSAHLWRASVAAIVSMAGCSVVHSSPMLVNVLAGARLSVASSSGTSGRISSSRFDRARIKTTAMLNFVTSCCDEIFRSTVTNASNSFSASLSNSPFLNPVQPRRGTVVTACSVRKRVKRAGKHSSSRTFTHEGFQSSHCASYNALLCFFKKRNYLLARNRWEIFKEFVDGIAAFQVIDQILDRDACSDKARRAAHDLRVDFNHRTAHRFHFPIVQCTPQPFTRSSARRWRSDALLASWSRLLRQRVKGLPFLWT